jgi:hypothetical protein
MAQLQAAPDFPIPTPDPVQYTPPQPPDEPKQGMTPPPAASGWEKKGGQAANIAANFLHGWIAGRNIHRERQQKQEVNEISMQRQQYENNMEVYHNRLSAGADPNSPEMKELGKTVASAYRDYMATMGKFSGFHDDQQTGDVKGKKPGAAAAVGRGVKKAVMGPPLPQLIGQHLYQESMKKSIQSTQTGDVSWLPGAQLTGQDKLAQAEVQKAKDEQWQRQQAMTVQKEIHQGIKDAVQDPKKMDQLEKEWPAVRADAKINGLPDPGELPKPGEEAFDARVNQYKRETVEGLMTGKTKMTDLNDFQKYAVLGVAPQEAPWEFYKTFVPATITDPAEREKAAHKLFLQDELRMRSAGRDPTMAEQIKYNIREAHKGEAGWSEQDTAKEFLRLTTGNKGKLTDMKPSEQQNVKNGLYSNIVGGDTRTGLQPHPEWSNYLAYDPKANTIGISPETPADVRDQMLDAIVLEGTGSGLTVPEIRSAFPEAASRIPKDQQGMTPPPQEGAGQVATNPFRNKQNQKK